MSPRILLVDIETLPNLGYTWRKYEQNVIDFEREYVMATYASKWLGERKVSVKGLPDYRGYRPGSYDDRALCLDLRDELNEADIVVAHNGAAFDTKAINTRLLFHKIPPPSPYKIIDTKTQAKRIAMFNSNKLDDIGRYLGEGRKIDTTFKLWLDCIAGDPKAWAKMKRYNIHDVVLLERVYLRLRPYMTNHPSIASYTGVDCCKNCGSKHLNARGWEVTKTRRYRKFQCQDCGAWCSSTENSERTTKIK